MSPQWRFIVHLSEQLRFLRNPQEIQEVGSRLIREHLDATRVSYSVIDADDVHSFTGRRSLDEFETAIVDACRHGETVVTPALVAVPFLKDDGGIATVAVHSDTPRNWTPDQIALVEVTAERLWLLSERARVEEALGRIEGRQAFLCRLSDAVRPIADPTRILEEACRLVGVHLRVNRAVYGEIDGDDCVMCDGYVDGVPPLPRRFPWRYFADSRRPEILNGGTLTCNDTSAEGHAAEERPRLQAIGIGAYIGAFLVKDGRFVAAFAVHSQLPRAWTPDEIALVEEVADRIWATVEHRRAEAELRANARAEIVAREIEERFHRALTASGAGCWTWDPRTSEAHWDETFRSRFDFTPDERPSVEKFFSRVHPDDRPRLQASMQAILHTANRWENDYRFVFPDGTVRWMQSLGHADRDASGTVTRLTGFELDINDRRLTEEAMQARRDEEHDRELRLLLETATQGVVSINAHGTMVTANRAFELMFGWTAGELIGQPIDRLVPSAFREVHAQHRSNYFATPRPRLMAGLQLIGERRDGSTFPIEVSLNHVPSPDGGLAFAFITDITERQRAAEALQQRTAELEDRTKQLSRMAWDLTLAEHHAREQIAKTLHDGLQQLLVIAALNLDVHVKREAESGSAPNAVLLDTKHHLAEAISAARSLSRELFPPVLHGSGLPAALAWLANWMHEKYGLEVAVVANPLADSPRSDLRTLLYESARELLFNAFKHAKADDVSLELRLDGDDRLCLTVTDRGVGFDVAALDDRWKTGQAGWGLFSIRERLTLLGGRCDVESTPGGGTRVRLLAPRGTAKGAAEARPRIVPLPPAAPAAADPHVSREGLRILIVDDHAAVRNALRQMLHERPQLRVVGEGSDGIDAIVQARQLRPDVILMDVMMPHMNGIDATARIHAELPEIQILGLSMQARSETVHAIEEAGAAGFFVKGLDTQRLLDQLLALHASRAAAPS